MAENDIVSEGFVLSKPLKIRPMRSKDWKTFHQLDKEIFDQKDQIAKEFFKKRIKTPGFFAMETQQGDLIGYLVLGRFTNEIAHLGRIGIRKSEQGKGLGSRLMQHALNWFQKEKGVSQVQLYTQVDNLHAQGLYKKFGFNIIGQTWHYFIPFKTLTASGHYSVHLIKLAEHQMVANLFPNSLPIGAIKRFREKGQDVYTLKDSSGRIVGATRFTPSFPGCFPFELHPLSGFDDYVLAFQPLCDPPSKVLRITFHENKHLAALCESRGYQLHHKLFRMQLLLQK